MLVFFPAIYDEEILYSSISRYHYYMRNKNFKDTFQELFGDRNYIPSRLLPSHISYLENRLDNKHYTKEQIMDKYTLLPLYSLFLEEIRLDKIKQAMLSADGKAIYTLVGRVASKTRQKNKLHYCPVCCKEDYEANGEVYYHRIHQADGVYVCHKHKVVLNSKDIISKIELCRLCYRDIDTTIKRVDENNMYHVFAKSLAYILLNSNNISRDFILAQYKSILRFKGYIKNNSYIDQIRVQTEFNNKFSEEFLSKLNLSLNKKHHWLQKAIRTPANISDPVKHLLMMILLAGDAEHFIDFKEQYSPFGKAKWPCLNPICKNYRSKVISNCIITQDYKTKLPIGTFECDCGFIYSRKGPDNNDADKYKIGKIKSFGLVWKDTLSNHIVKGTIKLRDLCSLMQCDSNTIVKYAKQLNLLNKLDTKRDYVSKSQDNMFTREHIVSEYRDDIEQFMLLHSEMTRTQVRYKLQKQYTFLYRYDKEWLFNHLPNKQGRAIKSDTRVNWIERDNRLSEMIQSKVEEILIREPLVRVTKTLIGRELNVSSLLEKKIQLLPKCREGLDVLCESYDEFRLRRIKYWVDISHKSVTAWEIQRLAGIRSEYFTQLKDYIQELINIKRGTYG